MISEFERYHGVALRTIVVSARRPVTIQTCEEVGRIDSYRLNMTTAVHIKHSAKRLPPWLFTFTGDEMRELVALRTAAESLWLILVCGIDGVLSLSDSEFNEAVGASPDSTPFIRVDRDRRSMYRVFGNLGKLGAAKGNGVSPIIRDAFGEG
jgi:hypothetical protein